jgi:hypothetical protein
MGDRHQAESPEPNGEQPVLVPDEAQHVLAFHPKQHLADVTKIAEIEKADPKRDSQSQPEQGISEHCVASSVNLSDEQ